MQRFVFKVVSSIMIVGACVSAAVAQPPPPGPPPPHPPHPYHPYPYHPYPYHPYYGPPPPPPPSTRVVIMPGRVIRAAAVASSSQSTAAPAPAPAPTPEWHKISNPYPEVKSLWSDCNEHTCYEKVRVSVDKCQQSREIYLYYYDHGHLKEHYVTQKDKVC